jgi:hypothetical protein
MDALEALLSPQVIAGILFIAGLTMAVRSFLFYSKETAEAGPKLKKIDKDLKQLRDGMKDHKDSVETLSTEVDPMAEKEEKMRLYLEELKTIPDGYGEKGLHQ